MKSKLVYIFIFVSFFVHHSGQNKNNVITLSKNVHINYEIKKFDKSRHFIKFCKKGDEKFICEIDNKKWFGSDLQIENPKKELVKLAIKINGKPTNLDVSQMFNPNFTGQLNRNQFKLKKYKNYLKLFAYFSDGAGTYTAHWRIENGKSKRILVSTDEKDFEWQTE
ncbi:hypothetical protein [Halpernia sp.]|uniref:hypothetical protein n=1 Tax=Halpernia sp. TaxID=2782209 RepID=UPI003A9047E2